MGQEALSANLKIMNKKQEIPEGFVLVTRQIIKDNVYMGDEDVVVWGEAAERQLSMPNDQRNPHWRNVRYKETDSETIVKKIPQKDESPAANNPDAISEEQPAITIPKKRNRTV